jgi:hypothetical protein
MAANSVFALAWRAMVLRRGGAGDPLPKSSGALIYFDMSA